MEMHSNSSRTRSIPMARRTTGSGDFKLAEGQYVGQRADLIGSAKVGAQGNKIEIAYRAHVPTKDGETHDLDFKETFVFTQSGTADYRVAVSILFIPVGEAHLTIRKQPRRRGPRMP